jgi:hypothetical protein
MGLYELDTLLFRDFVPWRECVGLRRISKWHAGNINTWIPLWCKTLDHGEYPMALDSDDEINDYNDRYEEGLARARRRRMVDMLESNGWPRLNFAACRRTRSGPTTEIFQIPNCRLFIEIIFDTREQYLFFIGYQAVISEDVDVLLFISRAPSPETKGSARYKEVPLFSTASLFRSFCSTVLSRLEISRSEEECNTILRDAIPDMYWSKLRLGGSPKSHWAPPVDPTPEEGDSPRPVQLSISRLHDENND